MTLSQKIKLASDDTLKQLIAALRKKPRLAAWDDKKMMLASEELERRGH